MQQFKAAFYIIIASNKQTHGSSEQFDKPWSVGFNDPIILSILLAIDSFGTEWGWLSSPPHKIKICLVQLKICCLLL